MKSVPGAGSWSFDNHMHLYQLYYGDGDGDDGFVNDPIAHPLGKIPGKSQVAVLKFLEKIWRGEGPAGLLRFFPKDPSIWSAEDEQDLQRQLEVRVRGRATGETPIIRSPPILTHLKSLTRVRLTIPTRLYLQDRIDIPHIKGKSQEAVRRRMIELAVGAPQV